MKIEINNQTKLKIDKKLFTGLAKKVIKGENKEMDLSIAFISTEEIKKANKKYRGKNKPTDVLSFNFGSWGEVVICPALVKKGEMAKILIHGVLHICGYDHEKSEKEANRMEQKQNFYLLKNK